VGCIADLDTVAKRKKSLPLPGIEHHPQQSFGNGAIDWHVIGRREKKSSSSFNEHPSLYDAVRVQGNHVCVKSATSNYLVSSKLRIRQIDTPSCSSYLILIFSMRKLSFVRTLLQGLSYQKLATAQFPSIIRRSVTITLSDCVSEDWLLSMDFTLEIVMKFVYSRKELRCSLTHLTLQTCPL
jgi:hypothetical protein